MSPNPDRRVADRMTPDPLPIAPEASLDEALALFQDHGFRHLPVVSGGSLVGILSDRDLSLATGRVPFADRLPGLPGSRGEDALHPPGLVSEVMRSPVVTVAPERPLREAAGLLLEEQVGSLPVVGGERLVGILTDTDLLREFRMECDDHPDGPGHCETVEHHMQHEVVSLGPGDTVEDAIGLCLAHGFHHVPVVEDGTLLGLVSDRDLKLGFGRAIAADLVAEEEGRLEVSPLALSSVMTHCVVDVDPRFRLCRAAAILIKNKFSALPITDGGRLVGILTQTDILRHYAAARPAVRS